MIFEKDLIKSCKNVLKKLNLEGFELYEVINYSKKDNDHYYFFIWEDGMIEIVVSFDDNYGFSTDKIKVSMQKPEHKTLDFDNRWLKFDEDGLYDAVKELLLEVY